MTDWLDAVAEREPGDWVSVEDADCVELTAAERDRLIAIARAAVELAETALDEYDGAPREPGGTPKQTTVVPVELAVRVLTLAGRAP